ncbi:MAG: acetate--CoA ligase family protein [Pseudomonadota bacterium]
MNPEPNIRALLSPGSIAVVGASEDTLKLGGGRILKNLIESSFAGPLYPVNPNRSEVLGLPAFPTVSAIGKSVDLVVIVVPGERVEAAVLDCAAAGVPGVIVISAGFAERGDDLGRQRQVRLIAMAREHGITLCGPNSEGIINFVEDIPASFSTALDMEGNKVGSSALVAQSGAVGTYAVSLCRQRGIGVHSFISTGNEAALDFADYVAYLADQPEVQLIAAYIESCRKPRLLLEAARHAHQNGKRVGVLRAGLSATGNKAASSHTGAMADDQALWNALQVKAGIAPIASIEELVDFMAVAGSPYAKRIWGKRFGVLTTSGGVGVIMADRADAAGLILPDFAPDTEERLKGITAFGTHTNPLDGAGSLSAPERLYGALACIGEDPNVDVVVAATGVAYSMGENVANNFVRFAEASEKPFLVSWVSAPEAALKILQERNVPVFPDPNRTLAVMGHMAIRPPQPVEATRMEDSAAAPFPDQHGLLTYAQSKAILARAGFPFAPSSVAASEQEALQAAGALGYPVVVKGESRTIVHKNKGGLVRLGITNDAELRDAVRAILPLSDGRVSVEKMAGPGIEVIVGAKVDAKYGPALIVGLGGELTELLGDTALTLAPASATEIAGLILSLKTYRHLAAYPQALKDLEEIALTLARWVCHHQDSVQEVEFNPVRLCEGGAVALDCRLILR